MVQESYGVNAFRAFVIFHLYPIKIAFSQKFRLPIGFFAFPENILYVENFRHKKKTGEPVLFLFIHHKNS